MDKNLLKLLRTLFGLSDKNLPDSISPEDLGKLLEKSAGNLVKTEDFKKLQQSLSAKDLDLKNLQDQIKELTAKKDENLSASEKMIADLKTSVETLTTTISTMKSEQDTARLASQYPDILPELLIGKSPDEVEKIVDRQREINKKLYGDSRQFIKPDYSTEAEIEARKKEIMADKTKSGEQAAAEVMALDRKKSQLSA